MKIISATHNDLHSIATLMVKKYQRLNDYIGYDMYKTDYDLFLRVWSERIADPSSEYSLFVQLEDGVFWGFLALNLHKQKWEVLMVALEEAGSPLKFSELLDFAVSLLKEKGAEFVTFELSPLEKELLEGEQQKSAKEFSTKYVL